MQSGVNALRRGVAIGALLLLGGPLAASADALPHPHLILAYTRGQVAARVNGVPVLAAGEAVSAEFVTASSTMDLAPWLRSGENTIEVDFRRKLPGDLSLTVEIVDDPTAMTPTMLAEGKSAKEGTTTLTLSVEMPLWAMYDAAVVANPGPEVIAVVKELRSVMEAKDAKAFHTKFEIFEREMIQMYGDAFAEFSKGVDEMVRTATLKPMPKLVVKTFLDGRLVQVTGEDGAAPVRATTPNDETLELGQWWAKVNGVWQIVRT